jgi:transposase-like protein
MNEPTIKRRRRFTPEQKAEAVDLCLRENIPCSEVARRLNISASALSSWVRQARVDRGEARPIDRGLLTTQEREELNRLRKENRELRREKDFFRLAAAHFAKEQLPPRGFA